MRHLKDDDPQHTVIMVQPRTRVGSYGSVRDYSPEANRLFAGPIPAELAQQDWASSRAPGRRCSAAMPRCCSTPGAIASYIDAIAAAGKAVKPLPMYVNAALPGDPFGVARSEQLCAAAGRLPAALDMWKAAAPQIDCRRARHLRSATTRRI